jgi:hypothetical protein
VAERVLQQVVDDLAEAHWIDLDCRSVEDGRGEGETYTTGLGVCAEGGDRCRYQVEEVRALPIEG